MSYSINKITLLLFLCFFLSLFSISLAETRPDVKTELEIKLLYADEVFTQGNYKEALSLYKKMLDKKTEFSAAALKNSIIALQRLNRHNETDSFIREVLNTNTNNYLAFRTAAELYNRNLLHTGYISGNKFYRGYTSNYTTRIDTRKFDHLYALQYMKEAEKLLLRSSADNTTKAEFYYDFAQLYIDDINNHNATELLLKSNFTNIPPYTSELPEYNLYSQGSPVNKEGEPIFFQLPKDSQSASNDGELFRWYLHQSSIYAGNSENEKITLAKFSERLYGIETITSYHPLLNNLAGEDQNKLLLKLHRLKNNETVARLATGIKKFSLPPDYSYLQLYIDLADKYNNLESIMKTAQLFMQRNQFSSAAEYWKKYLNSPSSHKANKDYANKQLAQITSSFIRFDSISNQPASKPAQFTLLYRNTSSVNIVLKKIDLNIVIADTINYIENESNTVNNQLMELDDLGWRIIANNQDKYIGAEVLRQTIQLQNNNTEIAHATLKEAITLPQILPGGAYLLEASLDNGYTCKTLLWLSKLAITSKHLTGDKELFFTSDANTGNILPNTTIDIFGFPRNLRADTSAVKENFFEKTYKTDNNGCLVINSLPEDYSYILSATDQHHDFAYLGIADFFRPYYYNAVKNNRIFYITDRPLYKKGETIKVTGYLREYNIADNSNTIPEKISSIQINLYNPKAEKINSVNVAIDRNGKFNFSYQSSSNDTLGNWHFSADLPDTAETGNHFRIEEYKKPEYTVEILPPEDNPGINRPFNLDFIASYLFDAPLQNANIDYTVTRSSRTVRPFLPAKWDWLYGAGFTENSLDKLASSCFPSPVPSSDSPEVVAAGRVYTGTDGKATITVIPSLPEDADKIQACEYTVTATVRDSNNNVNEKTVSFTLQQQEYNLIPALDKNFYHFDDTIKVSFSRSDKNNSDITPNSIPQATLRLFKLTAQDTEELITDKQITDNNSNTVSTEFHAVSAGLHRIECKTTDHFGNKIKSSRTFFIIPEDNQDIFIPETLTVIPEYNIYNPGDEADILILSKNDNGEILLFTPNAENYHLINISANYSLFTYKVSKRDIPNFFITCLSTSDAKLHNDSAELFVPPTNKILNITVTAAEKQYHPDKTAKLILKARDSAGKAFSGSAVVTVYDSALDQLTAESHYPSIKDFFWGFTRSNITRYLSNLQKYSYNIYPDNIEPMEQLGPFDTFFINSSHHFPGVMRKTAGGINMLSMTVADNDIPAPEMMLAAAPAKEGAQTTGQDSAIRRNFSTSAYFTDKITFDSNGEAEINFNLPDTLTTWKVKFWAISSDTAVNRAQTEFITQKDLIILPNIPRFLIAGDISRLYTTIYNNSDTEINISTDITSSDNLQITSAANKTISIPANSSTKNSYIVKAAKTGDVTLRFSAENSALNDGVELHLPVLKHSQNIFTSTTGIITAQNNTKRLKLTLPESINSAATRLQLTVYSDLLPLITGITGNTTRTAENTNDNIISKLLPELYLSRLQADRAGNTAQDKNIIPAEIQNKFAAATVRLAELQLPDGGWSWLGRGYCSSPFITATILYSLEKARKLGINIPAAIITGARLYLLDYQMNELAKIKKIPIDNKTETKAHADNLDALVYTTLAAGGNNNAAMRNILFNDRLKLSVYSLSVFARGLLEESNSDLLPQVLHNLEQYLVTDTENATAFLDYDNSNYWWYWYGSKIETLANVLFLRLKTGNNSSDINTMLVHYLLNNIRHNNSWGSVKRAEVIVSALCAYLQSQPEIAADSSIEISLNNSYIRKVNPANANKTVQLSFTPDLLKQGNNLLQITSTSEQPVYYTTTLSYESTAGNISAEGKEIKTARKYYLLTPHTVSVILPDPKGGEKELKQLKYSRHELTADDIIHTGDLIETEIILTSKNDYEYIRLTDNKPAAFEPIEHKSGYRYTGLSYYAEYENSCINYYISSLPRGTHTLSYRSYSVFSGSFSALPADTTGCYAIELNSNSAEFKFSIAEDK